MASLPLSCFPKVLQVLHPFTDCAAAFIPNASRSESASASLQAMPPASGLRTQP